MDRSAFDAHPIWASTTSLDSALTLAEAQNDASVSSQLGEVRYLVSLIRSHATPTDVAPYSVTGLNAVNGSLPNITSELNNFVSNGNPQHATNAASYSDAVLNQIGSWPTQTLKGGAAGVANRLFAEYRDAAEAALTAMRASNREMAEKLDSQQTESAAAIAALRSDLADLTVKITADETRLDTALTTSNEAFTAKQTEREEKFTAWLAEQGKALKDLANGDLEVIQSHRTSAQSALEAIDKLRDDTQTVAGLAAGDQVARGYKKYSLRQWIAGLIAYTVGFAFLAVGAWLVIRTFKGIEPTDEISWQFTLLKLGLTASAVFAAVVAFRLGSHLLAEASTAKRFELELKALGPLFPHDTEQDTLKGVKKDLIERSFGHGWSTGEKSKEVMNVKLLERLVEAVARGVGRPPGT